MKTFTINTLKIIFSTLIISAGVFSFQTAQAYSSQPTQYAYTDGSYIYNYQIYSTPVQSQYYNVQLRQLQLQIAQLQKLLLQLQGNQSSGSSVDYDDDSEVEINTRSASEVRRSSAVLRGRVDDFNRSDYADVWFEYGTRNNNLDKRTPIKKIYETDWGDFSQLVAGLRSNTKYYYRAVADDEYGEQNVGEILTFKTSYYYADSDYDDSPTLSTRSAGDVDYNSVRLEGTVDMNDFENGEVFFVYGKDRYQVENIADDNNRYLDIYEDGDYLRTYRVDRYLDNRSTYKINISGLNEDTRYYFTLCVGYEDEYNDDVLRCSSVRDFITRYW